MMTSFFDPTVRAQNLNPKGPVIVSGINSVEQTNLFESLLAVATFADGCSSKSFDEKAGLLKVMGHRIAPKCKRSLPSKAGSGFRACTIRDAIGFGAAKRNISEEIQHA
ncbi:hypothetical protein K1T73_01225 [Roseovarius sp. SCSIO 43702]|uniref:hypothetical protein n=1 Tax=Roseovarius sp. SCSIO 43702 TaxID=2823043 RepID=UPI001C73C345|nr:hypothetical protein [Roseovarius sp. SCSIO 43702]QYX57069.1 hypothetical protein K1T73_01225 [Roseovarius sp. SCSIO 43702]